MHKALVMENCLSKVGNLNGDRQPPFLFFKFSFSRTRVCVCVFIYFIRVFIFNLTWVLFKFIKFIIYFVIVFTHFLEKMSIQNPENSEKDKSGTNQEVRKKEK